MQDMESDFFIHVNICYFIGLVWISVINHEKSVQ